MTTITIIDHGRHDMFEMTIQYDDGKGLTIAGASLIGVIERTLLELVDDDFKKTQAIMEILRGSKPSAIKDENDG